MVLQKLIELTDLHKSSCKEYADFVESMFPGRSPQTLAELPYLPVRAFKEFDLLSIDREAVFKMMTSSGTTGQYSRIYLDRETAQLQTKTLINIFSSAFSKTRFPMLIIDSESTVKNKKKFSARTAAINGFSLFSRSRCFALDEDLTLNVMRVKEFLEENKESTIFVFGFTFLIWKNFLQALIQKAEVLNLSNAFFLHGGGWKKLQSQSVSNDKFKEVIRELTGCRDVRNYYGMVEQTGSIFMECRHGNLHASAQSDALARDENSHNVLSHGEKGIIQVFSTIQKSYPGHSLLTEDIGYTLDGSTCACGQRGTIVNVLGRLEQAEVRGCSDAYT